MTIVRAMAGHAFWLGAAIIGSYVFGSIWDDTNKRKFQTSQAEQENPDA